MSEEQLSPFVLNGSETELFNALSLSIKKNPLSPDSLIHLYDVYSLSDTINPRSILTLTDRFIENISRSHLTEKNSILLQANLLKEELCYNNRISIDRAIPPDSFLTDWRVSDVYKTYGPYDFSLSFPPENDNKAFHKVFKGSSFHGKTELSSFSYPSDGIIYTKTTVSSSSSVSFRITSNAEYLLFINGQLLIENVHDKDYSEKRIIETLKPGTYSLTFKFRLKPTAYFSVQTTTSNNIPITLSYSSGTPSLATEFKEVYDYPYNRYLTDGSPASLAKAGWLLADMKDKRGLIYLKQSLNSKYTLLNDIIVATTLINQFERQDWRHKEGYSRIKKLWDKHPDLPVLQLWKSSYLYSQRNYSEALTLLNSKQPDSYFAASLLKLQLYRKTADHFKFRGLAEDLLDKAPHSKKLHSIYLDYLYTEQKDLFITEAEKYLEIRRDEDIQQKLISIYKGSDSEKAADLLREDLLQKKHNALVQSASIMINNENYSEASTLLLSFAPFNNSPSVFYLLGLAALKQGGTPDPYFNMIEYNYPEDPFIREFYSFHQRATLSDLSYLRNTKKSEAILKQFFNNEGPCSVYPRKEHIIKIYGNGSATLLSDELIYITSNNQIRTYGEYKIPFNKGASIITARVYNRNGSYTDSVQLHSIGNAQYITINNLKKDTLLHIVYQNDLPTDLYKSSLFEYTSDSLMTYDHSLDEFEITILYPQTDSLNFYANYPGAIQKELSGKYKSLNYISTNIEKISYEPYSGYHTGTPLRYAVSTLKDDDDLFSWYRGFFPEPSTFHRNLGYDHSSRENLVTSIYNDIIANFTIEGSLRFYPQNPADTFYNKKGTSEDLVFLCRALLFHYGIHSYPVLIEKQTNKLKPLQKSSFSDVVLYIPNLESPKWLDFSANFLKPGSLTATNYLSTGYILKEQSVEKTFISTNKMSYIAPKQVNKWKIDLSSEGDNFSVTSTYHGEEETIRKYFKDSRYTEYYITQIYDSLQNHLIINSFSIDDPLNLMDPFSIKSKGLILGYSTIFKDALIIEPYISQNRAISFINSAERKSDLHIPYSINQKDIYIITLPDDFKQSKISFSNKTTFKNSSFRFSAEKMDGSLKLLCTEEVLIPKQVVSKDDYNQFKEFVSRSNTIKNRSFIFTRDKP